MKALAGIKARKDDISRDGRFYTIKYGYIKGSHIPTTIQQFRVWWTTYIRKDMSMVIFDLPT